jgi:hypothetical protein
MAEKAFEGVTPFFSYCPNVIPLPTAGFEEVLMEVVVPRGAVQRRVQEVRKER